jgi:hypothetical protein
MQVGRPVLVRSLSRFYFRLECESEAKIGLYKVFHRRIERMLTATDPVVAHLAKDSDMGSKPILESTADVREPAIVIHVRRCVIEPLIYRWKGRVDRVSSRAGENTAAVQALRAWPWSLDIHNSKSTLRRSIFV